MLKAHTLSTSEKRRYATRSRAVKRIPLRLRLNQELSFFDDIVEDEEKAALILRLQQEDWEDTMRWREEHKNDRKWWE